MEKQICKKNIIVRKFDRKLKGNWYDIAGRDQLTYTIAFTFTSKNRQRIFNSKVIYSGRPCIGVYDDENVHLLEPHQETSQLSVDSLLFWAPLYDTNKENGGLAVYEDSHRHGYFDHTLDHPEGTKVGQSSILM